MSDVIAQAVQDIELRSARFDRSILANAYGYLWLYTGTDKKIHSMRRQLLAMLDKREQEHGIEQAQKFRNDFGQYRHIHDFSEDVPANAGFYRARVCRCGAKLSEPR